MKRWTAAVLAALVLMLGGCGMATRRAWAPDFEGICDGGQPLPSRTAKLTDYLVKWLQQVGRERAVGTSGPVNCVHMLGLRGPQGQADGGVLAYAWAGREGTPAAFAWQGGGGWQTATVDLSAGEPAGYPMGGTARFPGGKPDLLLALVGPGWGGFGQLVHAAADRDALKVVPATPTYAHARFDFPEADLVLLTYRKGIPQPAAWPCNACVPATDQVLLRWDSESGNVRKVGQRSFPDPGLTVNLLLGALQAGDLKGAAPYVDQPATAAELAKELGLPAAGTVPWQPDGRPDDPARRAAELERLNWDLLPPKFRTRLTAADRILDLPLTRGKERVTLRMARFDRGWVVTDVHREQ